MTVMTMGALDGFLRKPVPEIGALLVYGADAAAVHDLASRIVERVVGKLDSPFAVTKLDDSLIFADPGRMLDEVRSPSLWGGRRVVWVRGAGQHFLKAVEPILNGMVSGNLIVAESGILIRGSAMRSRFEVSGHAWILPVYEASDENAGAMIDGALRVLGLRIGDEGRNRLIELSGRAGSILERELEKLASYCLGADSVTVADVEAVGGNAVGMEADELIDAVLGGDVSSADRCFFLLTRSGVEAGWLLTAVHTQLMRLIELRQNVERGMQAEQAVKSARPSIFFRRQVAVQAQLQAWNMQGLLSAASSISAAILQVRLNPALGNSLANRAVLAVARSSRAARTR